MKECDNSKIHISSNFILSVSLLIMFDTLVLKPSLHCNTLLHFTTLHPTTLHCTYRQMPYFMIILMVYLNLLKFSSCIFYDHFYFVATVKKIHISSNFILSISLLIMFDTLVLKPSLHCNTLLHFTALIDKCLIS